VARLLRPLVAAGLVPVMAGSGLPEGVLSQAFGARELWIQTDGSGAVSVVPARPPSVAPLLVPN
jgi:hypothetical protein